MDMSGMDMGMGHAGHAGSPVAPIDNQVVARTIWIVFAVLIAIFGLVRILAFWADKTLAERRNCKCENQRTSNIFIKTFKFLEAIFREATYPQMRIRFRQRTLFSVTAGRFYVLSLYWSFILGCLFYKAIVKDAYYYEAIGFRAAWVSLALVPMLLLFSAKSPFSPVSLITRISYEKYNWIHRWISRTLLLCVAIHGGHFLWEWMLYDFIQEELRTMSMVKFGLSAFGLLGGIVFFSIPVIRKSSYEIFYFSHMIMAGAFLTMLWFHIPSYARFYFYLAIAIPIFDRILRGVAYVVNGKVEITDIDVLSSDIVALEIKTKRCWKAGQHMHLNIPRIGLFHSHPFTIASVSDLSKTTQTMRFVIKSHKGLTRSLRERKNSLEASTKLMAFMHGPYGPSLDFEYASSIILIAGGTGASFTIPLLYRAMESKCCCKRVHFIWAIKDVQNVEWFSNDIRSIASKIGSKGTKINLSLSIHVTGRVQSEKQKLPMNEFSDLEALCNEGIKVHKGRPPLFSMISKEFDRALGETSVCVCGPLDMQYDVRNIVASLCDERAVHKGTGAHGVHLHVEEFEY